MGRRARTEIWAAILSAIEVERGRSAGTVRPTRVRTSANLPHARFLAHVDRLDAHGLLCKDALRLTDEGRDFLRTAQMVAEWTRPDHRPRTE